MDFVFLERTGMIPPDVRETKRRQLIVVPQEPQFTLLLPQVGLASQKERLNLLKSILKAPD